MRTKYHVRGCDGCLKAAALMKRKGQFYWEVDAIEDSNTDWHEG